MKDQDRGVYDKYSVVERTDGRHAPGEKHHNCQYFVLDLSHDPHSIEALRAYAESCASEYPNLASDLLRQVVRMEEREPEDWE